MICKLSHWSGVKRLVNIHLAIRIEYNYYYIHISPEAIERLKDATWRHESPDYLNEQPLWWCVTTGTSSSVMSSASPFLASLAAAATPQGGRAAKRKKADEGSKEEEDPSINKLLLNVSSLLLTEQRTTACRNGTTQLLPADHPLTLVQTEARESYQSAQPSKDNG